MLPFFSVKFNNPHSQPTKHNHSIIRDIEKAREQNNGMQNILNQGKWAKRKAPTFKIKKLKFDK